MAGVSCNRLCGLVMLEESHTCCLEQAADVTLQQLLWGTTLGRGLQSHGHPPPHFRISVQAATAWGLQCADLQTACLTAQAVRCCKAFEPTRQGQGCFQDPWLMADSVSQHGMLQDRALCIQLQVGARTALRRDGQDWAHGRLF